MTFSLAVKMMYGTKKNPRLETHAVVSGIIGVLGARGQSNEVPHEFFFLRTHGPESKM